MEREEFKILVKAMKAVYAQPTFIPDKDAFDVWYGLLQDLPYEQANLAIQKYMTSERFPPTIADIRTKATEIIAPVEESMSELQAWALVQRALRNSGYNSEEEFAKLPEACQRAVGTAANLKEWALMDSDQVATIEQSHFGAADERRGTSAGECKDAHSRYGEETRSTYGKSSRPTDRNAKN